METAVSWEKVTLLCKNAAEGNGYLCYLLITTKKLLSFQFVYLVILFY